MLTIKHYKFLEFIRQVFVHITFKHIASPDSVREPALDIKSFEHSETMPLTAHDVFGQVLGFIGMIDILVSLPTEFFRIFNNNRNPVGYNADCCGRIIFSF